MIYTKNSMKSSIKFHRAQTSVLASLKRATRARYSELRRPTGLESDIFKYHLRKLVEIGYVIKANDGVYELTAEGKEFATRLDERTGRELLQPKASMLLVVRCIQDDTEYVLAHRRTREPFRDYWGIASAPVLRGVPIQVAASKELFKQTGIAADFSVVGMYRVIDTLTRGDVLEDKLFSLLVADVTGFPAPHKWYGGESRWMTQRELLAKQKLFPTTAKTLDMITTGIQFAEDVCVYQESDY